MGHLEHREGFASLKQVLVDDLGSKQARDDHGVQVRELIVEVEGLLARQDDRGLVGVQALVDVIRQVGQGNLAPLESGHLLNEVRTMIQDEVAASYHSVVVLIRANLGVLDVLPLALLDYIVRKQDLLLADGVGSSTTSAHIAPPLHMAQSVGAEI